MFESIKTLTSGGQRQPLGLARRGEPRARRLLCLGSCVALLWLWAGVPQARAASDLDLEMGVVAKNIKQLLADLGEDAISVGVFRGPEKLAASAGPAISKALTDALAKNNVTVRRRAALEVNGDYRDVDDRERKMLAVEIKTQVVDSSGAPIVQFKPRGVFNLATIASLLGTTVALPPTVDSAVREAHFTEGIDKPKVNLNEARVSAGRDSPYSVEVLVKAGDDYQPQVPTKGADGLAFVKLGRDDVYAVRLTNDAPHDVAVTLTIDGLSLFAFSENMNYTVLIVPAKTQTLVPGWHRTNQVSDSFVVTEYSKSAAASQFVSESGVGTITACFAAAWPRDKVPPGDEPAATEETRSGDATGQGPPVEKTYKEVVRSIGRLRAAVSVHYTKDVEPKSGQAVRR